MMCCLSQPKRLLVLALALGSTWLLSAFAPLAAEDTWQWGWNNGFKLDSPDGDIRLQFGGRLQADYAFASGDGGLAGVEDGFEFRRARLFFSGLLYERIEFMAQYELSGGDAAIRDAYIGFRNDWGTVRFGHWKEYFSLEEQVSSKHLAFIERSLPVLAFSPSYNAGVGAHGHAGSSFNWGIGAFYETDSFAEITDEDNVNLTGRVAYRPYFRDEGRRLIHLGISASHRDRNASIRFRSRPEAHRADRFVDTDTFAADSATLVALEFAAVHEAFWFAAEHLSATVDAPVNGDPAFDGFYLQAGYFLTGEHRRYKPAKGSFDRQRPTTTFGKDGGRGAWEIAARYSTIDLTDGVIAGGEQDNITLALNWYLNSATRLMVNWVHAEVEGNREGEGDFLLVRWQVDF